jgi:hypothetical protein
VALDINRWLVAAAILNPLTHLTRPVLGQHPPKIDIRSFMIFLLRRKGTFFDVSKPGSGGGRELDVCGLNRGLVSGRLG